VDFETLYITHKDLVYNLALNYCQNTEDAEEIAQDVFLALHQKLNTFKAKSELKTWVYRITVNKSLDFLKAKKTLKRSFFFTAKRIDDESTFNISDFRHPGVLLEEKESMAKIFAAINSLPENQKTAIILLKIEQRSKQETAEIMETSVKAIESLYQRAKNKLKEKLNENEGK